MHCPSCSTGISDSDLISPEMARCGHCGCTFKPGGKQTKVRLPKTIAQLAECVTNPEKAKALRQLYAIPEASGPPEPVADENQDERFQFYKPTRYIYFQEKPDGVDFLLPKAGLSAGGFFFVFGLIWTLITVGISLAIFAAEGFTWTMSFIFLFFAMFYAVGLGMLFWGVVMSFSEVAIGLDVNGLTYVKNLWGWKKVRNVSLAQVVQFSRKDWCRQNDVPQYACTVTIRKDKRDQDLYFGHHLNELDQAWIVWKGQKMLKSLREQT
jgi:hypothetical protein